MRNIVSGLQKCILLCLLVSLYVGWNADDVEMCPEYDSPLRREGGYGII